MNWLKRNFNSILGVILSFSWIALFAFGLLINSKPYRDALGTNLWSFIDLLAVLFTYTPTNIAFLAITSATVAGITSNINSMSYLKQLDNNGLDTKKMDTNSKSFQRLLYMNESPFVSMMRGFVIYLLLITGSFVVVDAPFENTSPEQYCRLASTISILAYSMGYDPTKIQDLLDKVSLKGSKVEN